MATVPSDINHITLDLLPNVSEAGKLHEQSDAEYLALNDYKSLFHFEVKSDLRIHGTGTFEEGEPKRPASLLVFTIQAIPNRQARPIKYASVKIAFEKDENQSDSTKKKAPRVRHIEPGIRPLEIKCTKEIQTQKDSIEASAEAQAGGDPASVKGGLKRSREKETEKEQEFFTSLRALKRPSVGHRFSNEPEWFFEENAS